MFNQNDLKLSKNKLSVDHYNCGKGQVFQKDKLMKIFIQTDKSGHSHIYHTYNMTEVIVPHCDSVTIENYPSVVEVLYEQGCVEQNQYVQSHQECQDLCIDTP